MYKKLFLVLTSTLALAACTTNSTEDGGQQLTESVQSIDTEITFSELSYDDIQNSLKELNLGDFMSDNPKGGSDVNEIVALLGSPDNVFDSDDYHSLYYSEHPEELSLSIQVDKSGGATTYELRDDKAKIITEEEILSIKDDGSYTVEELESSFGRPGIYQVFGKENTPKVNYRYMINDSHAASFEVQEGRVVSVSNPFETLRALEAEETETVETEAETETKEEPAEDRQAQDEEVKELIQGWVAENGYTDAIVDVRVNDLLVDIMVHSVIDLYGDNQKEEIFTTLGSQLNAELVAQGYEEKDFRFYNTAENEIGSYRITVLGDYKTELHD